MHTRKPDAGNEDRFQKKYVHQELKGGVALEVQGCFATRIKCAQEHIQDMYVCGLACACFLQLCVCVRTRARMVFVSVRVCVLAVSAAHENCEGIGLMRWVSSNKEMWLPSNSFRCLTGPALSITHLNASQGGGTRNRGPPHVCVCVRVFVCVCVYVCV